MVIEISGRIEEYVSGSGKVIGYELNIKKMLEKTGTFMLFIPNKSFQRIRINIEQDSYLQLLLLL